ncbi:hypothetical protein [Candidatus Allofournierella excrementigallinarum]|uniref:hypothetical protein n=1 Tax=Candidatus Allofournierella excrementigallinarum TaxID=2838592 RepID=UPI00374FBA48
MKKPPAFAACALAALLLAGCGERTCTGILTAPGDEAARTFTLQGEEGTVYSVKVAENAPVAAWPEGTEPGDLYSGNWPALRLSVKGRASLFGGEPVALTASSVQIDAARQPEGLTLAGGTSLSVWQASFDREYCAPDGTVLLEERLSGKAEDTIESVPGLTEAAKENILAFYEAQGILYDLPAQLERAWAAYSDSEVFDRYTLGQEVNLCAQNDSTLWFVTKVTLPLGGRVVTEEQFCAAFDKATGEVLAPDELFTCTGETLAAALLDAAGITDEPKRSELLAAFDESRVVFRGEALEVFYPEGAVPSEETALILGLDYTGEVKALLQPRAQPQKAA